MTLPPGIALIVRPVALAVIFLALGYSIQVLASRLTQLPLPTPRPLLGVAVFGFLFIAILRICIASIVIRLRAASLGARLVPAVRGRWPGNLDILADFRRNWNVAYPFEVFRPILQNSPTVNLHIGWGDYILTVEPEYIKIILATDFNNYVKGEALRNCMGSVLGTGVFNSDGEMWKFHRAATRPFFNRDRISDFDIFGQHADHAIALMKQRMRAGHPVDFEDLAGRFTMDSAADFLFGVCVNSLSAPLPYPHNAPFPPLASRAHSDRFVAAFTQCLTILSSRSRYDWIWPAFEFWADKTTEPMAVVNSFLEPIIRDAVEKRRVAGLLAGEGRAKEAATAPATLLDELLNITSDPKALKDEMLNILLAGRDTTMSVLTWVVYLSVPTQIISTPANPAHPHPSLSAYPAVCARLRTEILQHVGAERRPTYDDIREMKYLRAVINETMRLYPPVPSNLRESVNATTWPSRDPANPQPIYIPAGAKISYSVFGMHRRTDLWGPTAEEFDPDRFLDARLKTYLLPNPFQFLPFNAGPRFAYNEISFMLVRLLQVFASSTLDEDACPPHARVPEAWRAGRGRMAVERVRPRVQLTMSTEGGLWVRMQEADRELDESD
ncbi:cytochrome P450 [Mycena rebaudengoi]|nr:cytochrome P450 [Mycena rebaudengoi]